MKLIHCSDLHLDSPMETHLSGEQARVRSQELCGTFARLMAWAREQEAAAEGADQCGFCSPGLIMNVLAMERELKNPSEEEIKEYLAGNLCRCSGYMSQLRAIRKYLLEKGGQG